MSDQPLKHDCFVHVLTKDQVNNVKMLIKAFDNLASKLTIPDFQDLIGKDHNPYLGYRHYHGDRTSIPQHLTLFHAILESGNEIILEYYIQRYGKELATLDDNHGHKPLSYLLHTSLRPTSILAMSKILLRIYPAIINMETSEGFGLPLTVFINRICHDKAPYYDSIDFRSSKVKEAIKEDLKLGVYFISKGAKWQPALDSLGQKKIAINCHLWYRKIKPFAQQVLDSWLIPPIVQLILNYAIDPYVNVCFPPKLETVKALKITQWQEDIFHGSLYVRRYVDLIKMLLDFRE